jgi:hypothetical protein
MPGTTAKGFPYAQPADPLVQWPATSQSLAEKIDADTVTKGYVDALPLVQAGRAAANAADGVTVTFPVAYKTAPTVLVSHASAQSMGTAHQLFAETVTPTTVKIVALKSDGSALVAVDVVWVAVGERVT